MKSCLRVLAVSAAAALLLGGCVAVPYDPYYGAQAYPAYSTYPTYPAYQVQPGYSPYYSYPSSSVYFGYSSGWGGHGRWRH